MTKGTQVRIASLVAPHGTVFESLRDLHENREVGTIKQGPDGAGYCVIEFPSVGEDGRLNAHVSMLSFA